MRQVGTERKREEEEWEIPLTEIVWRGEKERREGWICLLDLSEYTLNYPLYRRFLLKFKRLSKNNSSYKNARQVTRMISNSATLFEDLFIFYLLFLFPCLPGM